MSRPAIGGPALQLAGGPRPGELGAAMLASGPDATSRNMTARKRNVVNVNTNEVNVRVAVILGAAFVFLLAVRKGFRPLLNS